MYKICVMTGSRADYGLLKNTIIKLKMNKKVDLSLVVSGNHFNPDYGMTVNEIIEDGFHGFDRVDAPECGDKVSGMSDATGQTVMNFSSYFAENKPDALIVLGDRYEAFAACIAAMMQQVMIIHISGGDVTEGAIDDTLRHCMTKMSMLHFTGCEQSRKRVIQLGEYPERVFNVGEPGVENALNMKLLSREELSCELAWDGVCKDYALVTFHPATNDGNIADAMNQLEELISAMKSRDDLHYIITLANADTGGSAINTRWMQVQEECSRIKVYSSLGILKYLSAMKYCKMVLGNSSSGIVEAPSFAVPTVNIGKRQQGRMMAESIICCEPVSDEITRGIDKALDCDFVESIKGVKSPFGDGNASDKIVNILIEYMDEYGSGVNKSFYDLQ